MSNLIEWAKKLQNDSKAIDFYRELLNHCVDIGEYKDQCAIKNNGVIEWHGMTLILPIVTSSILGNEVISKSWCQRRSEFRKVAILLYKCGCSQNVTYDCTS